MTFGDGLAIVLIGLFLLGIGGGIFSSAWWLLACLPLLLVVGAVAAVFWLASKAMEGWKAW